MCGITGFVDFSESRTDYDKEQVIRKMSRAIEHRGPDWEGTWVDNSHGIGHGIALGFRRLAIIDLSETGQQPMQSACGRYIIIFNGEIYNYKKLKSEIQETGKFTFPFRGTSDTEVLLAAFTTWGVTASLKKTNGMFAFAVWDRELKTLMLARDRLGEKPLYYGIFGKTLLFGSELKALKCHPAFVSEIERDVLTLFVRSGYIPAPYSIYKNISKLLPACSVTFSMATKTLGDVTPYWSALDMAEHGVKNPFKGSEADAAQELESLLMNSVQMRMESDVPLGAFLSGGIDSSSIVAMMQSLSSKPIKTFTMGYSESSYDESKDAKKIADHLRTDHTTTIVTPQDALNVIPLLPSLYDEPFSDSSQIPTYLVSKIARERVTVALSGDGGDELFGGYNRHSWGKVAWNLSTRVPHPLKHLFASGLNSIAPATWNSVFGRMGPFLPTKLRWSNPGEKFQKLSDILQAQVPEDVYQKLITQWKDPLKLVLNSSEPASLFTRPSQWPNFSDFSLRMMYLDLVTYLPDDILAKVDRASMGVSLEVRVPFLDHRIVEFAWTLPLEMKIKSGVTKHVLRKLLYKHVPKELVDRPKMGFSIPIDEWLRGPLRDWAESLLDPPKMKQEGFFDPSLVTEKWSQHQKRERNWQHQLWNVLQFQAWLKGV